MAATRGQRAVGRVGPDRLRAQRAHLADGVLALERGQVDHRDGEVQRPRLGGRLDGAGRQAGGARLAADLVDAGQTVQEAAQRSRGGDGCVDRVQRVGGARRCEAGGGDGGVTFPSLGALPAALKTNYSRNVILSLATVVDRLPFRGHGHYSGEHAERVGEPGGGGRRTRGGEVRRVRRSLARLDRCRDRRSDRLPGPVDRRVVRADRPAHRGRHCLLLLGHPRPASQPRPT